MLEEDSGTEESELNDSDSESEEDHVSEGSYNDDSGSSTDEHFENQQSKDNDVDEPNHVRSLDRKQGPSSRNAKQQPNTSITNVHQGKLTGKDGTVWDKVPPAQGRRRKQDIIKQPPGITAEARCDDIVQSFQLFLTQPIIMQIVRETNREGHQKTAEYNTVHPQSQVVWKSVDEVEIKAFIGLCILAGIQKSNFEPLSSLWSNVEGRPIFTATMSRNRFKDILSYMRFDNRETRSERKATDKVAAFSDVWQMFQVQLPKMYIPGPNLCVDEQLVAYRGRCPFRQYIPSKPSKYGLKIWWLCDSDTSYPLCGEIYSGRLPNEKREVGQGARIVKQLVGQYYHSGRNVTADNFFTTVPLVEELLNDGLTYVGTIRANKRQIPPEMKASADKELHSSMFAFKDQLTLVSYTPKAKKAVLVLSSLHHDIEVEEDRKPSIISYYNAMKSGVDNLDHLVSLTTCKRKTRRWPMVLFYNMVDVAAVAGFVIWLCNNPGWKAQEKKGRRRHYLLQLGKALAMPHVKHRSTVPQLKLPVKQAIQMVQLEGDDDATGQHAQVEN